VRRITLRTTRIETPDDGVLVMPNKEITGSTIYNYSLRHLARVRVPVDVSYDADVAHARQILLGLVPDSPSVSPRPAPEVAVTALGESGVRMELLFYVSEPKDMLPLGWRVSEAALLAFRDQGIEITYPHLNVHLPDAARAAEDGASDARGVQRTA